MTKQLVIIGDSFSHGIGTYSTHKHSENVNLAYGKYIADDLGLDYINLAEPGIANLKIIEIGYDYISKNKDKIELVIAGWTQPTRIGLYSNLNSLQLLPQFCWLGDSSATDIFVKTNNGVKFITDKNNKEYLDILPQLHRLLVSNDFFEVQRATSKVIIDCFLAWIKEQQVNIVDFDVFATELHHSTFDYSFQTVMSEVNRHPTADEQQKFADLLKRYINEH